MFNEQGSCSNMQILRHCPSMISEEDNTMLQELPSEQEIKDAIFSIDPNSCAGPDGFNGHFFQFSWDIINKEVTDFVNAFFYGYELTKIFTHTCPVLIPKVSSPDSFSQLRPVKNILLTQEIVQGIKVKYPHGNVVIKLDMSKAYDKLSWNYVLVVLRKLGFADPFIEMIHRLISNNWYSVLINGTRFGFFKSSRGLKQGDPLSPALFILAVETLTSALNHLHQREDFTGRKKICYFADISTKIINKIADWQGKFLAPRSKATLINYVLQSQTLYTFSALMPPKTTIKELEMHFSNLFWGQADGKNNYHWSS
ncbi:uncharacterized protein LOC132601254 [Lycium barbarum]|uniref:uncharacterized protein LOC132601254 n=1 Tax=Lycium barbarum TaxID=112863 RepID=UPI00293EE013|nr:uncharacterized protein LOC132601254 [Lycium barbarum]